MKTITFQIVDMDCVSCAVMIDADLEETKGVTKAQTHYAKAQTVVIFDPKKVTEKELIARIKRSGYTAKPLSIN